MKKFFISILGITRAERMFLLCAMLCGFCICAEYAIARPVSNSVFATTYGSDLLPYAWLMAVPLNFALVSLYNFLITRVGCWRTFFATVLCVGVGNGVLAVFLSESTWLPFLFYLWKDVYIMLLFQQLWSVIHTVTTRDRARLVYGILFGVGGLGGAVGSMIPGLLAVWAGSEHLLFCSFPICMFLLLAFTLLLRQAERLGFTGIISSEKKAAAGWNTWKQGFQLIGKSRLLIGILCLVAFMQVGSTLLDFQFQGMLTHEIPDKDLRTSFEGKVSGVINMATILLQFLGSYVLVRYLGLRGAHLLVPCVLATGALAFLCQPIFGVMTICFITIKSFDFSLFNIIKEMLYVPLSTEVKFSAKSVIDVFAYRAAKACASLLILLLGPIFISRTVPLTLGALLIFTLWAFTVHRMFTTPELAETENKV